MNSYLGALINIFNNLLLSLLHLYLAYRIQPVTPPLSADPAQLRGIFLRILQANLQRSANHELVSEDSLPEENLEEVEGALDVQTGGKGIERLEEDDERAVAFVETSGPGKLGCASWLSSYARR